VSIARDQEARHQLTRRNAPAGYGRGRRADQPRARRIQCLNDTLVAFPRSPFNRKESLMNRFIRSKRQQTNTPAFQIDFAAAKKPVLLDPGLYLARADIYSTSGRASSATTRASRSWRPAPDRCGAAPTVALPARPRPPTAMHRGRR